MKIITKENALLKELMTEEPRVAEIQNTADAVGDLLGKKLELINQFSKVYQIVFKNFVSVKKSVVQDFGENHKELFINRDGFSVKESYSKNSTYIDALGCREFIGYLKLMDKHYNKILEQIPRAEKKEVFKKLLEHINTIDPTSNYARQLNKEIVLPLSFLNSKKYAVSYSMENNAVRGYMKQDKVADMNITWLCANDPTSIKLMEQLPQKNSDGNYPATHWINNEYNQLDLRSTSLSDRLLISLFYDELVLFFREYKASEEIKLKNMQDFLDDIKTKFKAYLVLEGLKEKE
jgi:hypothetical protein